MASSTINSGDPSAFYMAHNAVRWGSPRKNAKGDTVQRFPPYAAPFFLPLYSFMLLPGDAAGLHSPVMCTRNAALKRFASFIRLSPGFSYIFYSRPPFFLCIVNSGQRMCSTLSCLTFHRHWHLIRLLNTPIDINQLIMLF